MGGGGAEFCSFESSAGFASERREQKPRPSVQGEGWDWGAGRAWPAPDGGGGSSCVQKQTDTWLNVLGSGTLLGSHGPRL